jgi:hypothetical protein
MRRKKIARKLSLVKTRLAIARRRYHRQRARGHHAKAQRLLGQIKRLVQRRDGLEQRQDQLEADAAAYQKQHQITVKGNVVSGGTPRQRVVVAAHASMNACSSRRRYNFYSQSGAWDVGHCISGPASSHRDDCSSWLTSAYLSAQAPDPNKQNYRDGYTGTLYNGTKGINRSQLQPGDIVIYGSPPGHHTELYVGPGDRTVGHGSPPVDFGTIDLFGDGDYHLRRAQI